MSRKRAHDEVSRYTCADGRSFVREYRPALKDLVARFPSREYSAEGDKVCFAHSDEEEAPFLEREPVGKDVKFPAFDPARVAQYREIVRSLGLCFDVDEFTMHDLYVEVSLRDSVCTAQMRKFQALSPVAFERTRLRAADGRLVLSVSTAFRAQQ